MGIEIFPSVNAIIEYLEAMYPASRAGKVTDAAGDLCVEVALKNGAVKLFAVRDCQGSGYFITDIPARE